MSSALYNLTQVCSPQTALSLALLLPPTRSFTVLSAVISRVWYKSARVLVLLSLFFYHSFPPSDSPFIPAFRAHHHTKIIKMSRQCMSISAIVAPTTPPPEAPLSPPDSTTDRSFSSYSLSSTPSSPLIASLTSPLIVQNSKLRHRDQKQQTSDNNSNYNHKFHSNGSTATSISLEERRHRNKLASAKYRAKKQASMRAMAAKLAQVTAQNAALQRDLAKAHQDNESLRQLCSSLMAKASSSSKTSSPPSPA